MNILIKSSVLIFYYVVFYILIYISFILKNYFPEMLYQFPLHKIIIFYHYQYQLLLCHY